MKTTNQITNIFLAILIVVSLFSLWYKEHYSMGIIYPYEINEKDKETSILIATQESLFKDELTCGLIERIQYDDVHLKIIDVTGLSRQDETQYDIIFIIHTWEMWRPPAEVKTFMKGVSDPSKVYTIGTSGGGELLLEGVDGISTASNLSNKEYIIGKAIKWYYSKMSSITMNQDIIH